MIAKAKLSPLAPTQFPSLPNIDGLRFATGVCGIKSVDRTDVLLGEFDTGTAVAGVLTCSKTASAPVDWCRKILPGGQAQALIVNSGNANAFTGKKGWATVEATVDSVADALTCRPSRVFTASTGVIGEPFSAETITSKMNQIAGDLRDTNDPEIWKAAASAIMTTDTFPKGGSAKTSISGTEIKIVGIAKGSGMIAPNMATMHALRVCKKPGGYERPTSTTQHLHDMRGTCTGEVGE